MAKPSERNRMMRDIAGVAMEEELTARCGLYARDDRC